MINIYGTPWRTWKKAKKYFRFPDIRLRAAIRPRLLHYFWNWYDFLYVSDVSWKDKYNEPRHEDNPCIAINFFNLLQFKIEFGRWIKGKDYSMEYWEALLCFVKYNKSLEESLQFSIWEDMKGNKTPIKKVCLR
jgi:hypothetical protein